MKFEELYNMAYKHKYQYSKGKETFVKYGKQICKIITDFENSTDEKFINFNCISDFTPVIALEIIAIFREKGNKASTIQRKMNTLRGIFKFAFENELIERKPKIPYLSIRNSIQIYFFKEDKIKLIKYFEKTDRKMYLYCMLAFKTGIRIGNIVTLDDENFTEDDIVLTETKNGESFSLPMTEEIKEVVKELKELNYFKGWNDQHIRYRFKKAIKILGLNPKYTPHKARHTFTTEISQTGTDDNLGQELTGHKTLKMYKHYNHYDKRDEKLEALNRLEKIS